MPLDVFYCHLSVLVLHRSFYSAISPYFAPHFVTPVCVGHYINKLYLLTDDIQWFLSLNVLIAIKMDKSTSYHRTIVIWTENLLDD